MDPEEYAAGRGAAPTIVSAVRVHRTGQFWTPPYVLTVTARDLNARRERWARERRHGREHKSATPWQPPAASTPAAGLLVLVDGDGRIAHRAAAENPQGILGHEGGLLVAEHHRI